MTIYFILLLGREPPNEREKDKRDVAIVSGKNDKTRILMILWHL